MIALWSDNDVHSNRLIFRDQQTQQLLANEAPQTQQKCSSCVKQTLKFQLTSAALLADPRDTFGLKPVFANFFGEFTMHEVK